MCYDERSMAKGGPGTMVGRTSLYWHHFGSGHLHLSCYLTSAESSPHCHYQVFLTPHLFVYFRVAKSRKKFKNLFLADLPSLENWDSSSSGKTLICLGHDYVPLRHMLSRQETGCQWVPLRTDSAVWELTFLCLAGIIPKR